MTGRTPDTEALEVEAEALIPEWLQEVASLESHNYFPWDIPASRKHCAVLKRSDYTRFLSEVLELLDEEQNKDAYPSRHLRSVAARYRGILKGAVSDVVYYHWYLALQRVFTQRPELRELVTHTFPRQDQHDAHSDGT